MKQKPMKQKPMKQESPPARRSPFMFTGFHRLAAYGAFVLVVATGGVWTVCWHLLREDPEMRHPMEPWLVKTHGAAAFVFLVLFGAALPQHAKMAWKARKNRAAGVALIAVCAASMLTGWMIFCIEWAHDAVHWIHVVAGMALPIVLPWHIVAGRRSMALKAK